MIYIPLPKDKPFFTLRTTLDGADYLLRFEWNMRAGWFLGVSAVGDNGTETVVCAPRKLLSDRNHLQYVTADARPRGFLGLVDGTGARAKPGYEDLGVRHTLLYLTEDEVNARLEELQS